MDTNLFDDDASIYGCDDGLDLVTGEMPPLDLLEDEAEDIEVQQDLAVDSLELKSEDVKVTETLPLISDDLFEVECEPVQQTIQVYDFSAEAINPELDSFIKEFKYTWRFNPERNEYNLHNNVTGKTSKELTGKTYVYVRPDLILEHFGDKLTISVEEISTQFVIHVKMNTGETLSIIDNVISASRGFVIYQGKTFKYKHDVASVTKVFEFLRTLDEKVFEGINEGAD